MERKGLKTPFPKSEWSKLFPSVWSSPEGGKPECIQSPSNISSIFCHKNESTPYPDPNPTSPQPEHLPGCVRNEWCWHRWKSTCSRAGGPTRGEEEPLTLQPNSASPHRHIRLTLLPVWICHIPLSAAEWVGRCAHGQMAEMLPQRGSCWGVFLHRVTVYQQMQGWPCRRLFRRLTSPKSLNPTRAVSLKLL